MSEPRWSLEGVPERPGVYLFRDGGGRVLYVGKSRSLRSRLRAYRRPGGDGRLLVRFLEHMAESVETIVTRTEQEALLLEDALIKQHKPPHNVRLKDDKSFLMLRLDMASEFPRFQFVRAHRPGFQKATGRSRYFGPFASSGAVRRTLSDLHRVVPLRDCPDSVFRNRTRPCIKHQIGLCGAPCVGLVSKAEYATQLERAARILSGETRELEEELEGRMRAASAELEYERAAHWRDRLAALRRTVERQGVRPRDRVDRDVLGLARTGHSAVVHRLAFRDGRLAESRSHSFRSELPDEELLHSTITALYGAGRRAAPKEVLLPCAPTDPELLTSALGGEVAWVVPQGGEGQRMIDLAGENARATLARGERNEDELRDALDELAKLADLEAPPETIDGFDISTFQGSSTVASRVRFRGGVSDRNGYRRYQVKTVDGQDDFAAMREVVERSLRRGVREGDLPDLVVIDGGPQQLATALEAREEAGAWEVPMIGLAKARSARTIRGRKHGPTHERIFLPGVEEPILLPRHTPARHLLERIRDEAHRFAITYHRKLRGKITSRLDSIPGIGDQRRKALLRRFGSLEGISKASVEELAAMPGISMGLARTIRDHLTKGAGS